jgi:hypothetical protein
MISTWLHIVIAYLALVEDDGKKCRPIGFGESEKACLEWDDPDYR